MEWYGKRALVTGATGFIGGHLVERLAGLGAEVHAVSRTSGAEPGSKAEGGSKAETGSKAEGGAKAEGGVFWHRADLRDPDATAGVVRSVDPHVVFHLASEVTGVRDPGMVLPTLEANLVSVVNVLTSVADRPGTRVVLAGSLEEPRPGEGAPSSPYAVAKWAAGGYAEMFHRLWGVQVSSLRIAMVYGPGQRDTSKLLPYVTLSLLRGERPSLTSGTRLLDWVYVDDVVEAFVAAGASGRAAGHSLEIGSGTGTSIRETVELVERLTGRAAGARYGAISDRPLDSARIADPAQARDVLGWRPRVGLEEGLRRTIAWFAGRQGLIR
ncbi:NAD-dependent epimerase/dehydratase family protein [Nonomuraea sp. NPDC048916]|uniref:NAD-dependent epimerase/dehydratase family protein n=1 Tax=Nonomuraea sp. NPDC048916 TaxID=3154232 RepID=UPI0033D8CAF5